MKGGSAVVDTIQVVGRSGTPLFLEHSAAYYAASKLQVVLTALVCADCVRG